MSESFYDPSAMRGAKVQALFDRIAARYDLINDLQSFGLHRHWKRKLVEHSQPDEQPFELALDLCTGTGDIARRLTGRSRWVVGLDFSAPMLEQARLRWARPCPNLLLLRGNAEQIPFSDNSFDRVYIAYGLRNLSSLDIGLREMWRVTRPGGWIAILDFSKPNNLVWRQFYYLYLKRVVPIFGWIFHGDPRTYAYIFESLENYPSAERLRDSLLRLKASRVQVERLLGGVMAIHSAEKGGLRSSEPRQVLQ